MIGCLVEVINVPDQNAIEKLLVGKVGIVICNVLPNIYKVLISEKFYYLHRLDMKIL